MTSPPPAAPAAPESNSPRAGFAGLERAWAEHADAVFRAAYRVTGNAADAEDALQTVFLRLARCGAGELSEAAGGYLHRSAINSALDILRKRQRAGWVPLEPADGGRDGALAATGDPERDHQARQLGRDLRLALSRLSPRAAEAFALRYFEGLDHRSIGELLGISHGVVAVLLHRTRARLRKELAALERQAP